MCKNCFVVVKNGFLARKLKITAHFKMKNSMFELGKQIDQ